MDLGYVKRGFKREVVCCAMFARKAVRTPVSQGAVHIKAILVECRGFFFEFSRGRGPAKCNPAVETRLI